MVYTLMNVEKFLQENGRRISEEKRRGILKRARGEAGKEGLIAAEPETEGGGNVWQDAALQCDFHHALAKSLDHMQICLDAWPVKSRIGVGENPANTPVRKYNKDPSSPRWQNQGESTTKRSWWSRSVVSKKK